MCGYVVSVGSSLLSISLHYATSEAAEVNVARVTGHRCYDTEKK